jgi:crotonobetainyl-CoA:carnitine CoA-transferase CaiB-like acyl-CoA transferase
MTTETELWAASGAMALTGRRSGPPLLCAGSPATALSDSLRALADLGVPDLPGIELLGERAALAGMRRNAPWSPGGAFRIVPAADGWLGLSLARSSDVDLLPALVEGAVGDPWVSVAEWSTRTPAVVAAARAQLLGLPAAEVPTAAPRQNRDPVLITEGGVRRATRRPLVVDFSALWAGPLCAHVLGLAGARVVKVESTSRPDGARNGSAPFYDLLHAGHESVALDLARDTDMLRRMVARADVVIEASRPRALARFGLDARQEVQRGAVWVSITAAGRASDRVGFGDDVAAGAGLVAWEDATPLPAGDALADPLTGIAAAAAAMRALGRGRGALLDVSMHDVCAAAAVETRIGRPDVAPAEPTARTPVGQAASLGRDTAAVLSELAVTRTAL